RYRSRSSKGFAGTHVEIYCIHSFGARVLLVYTLSAELSSNNILRYHSRSSKGFSGTHVEIYCIHSFGARGLLVYTLSAELSSNNILRYRSRSSKGFAGTRSEEHTSELQSRFDLVCRLLLEKKN